MNITLNKNESENELTVILDGRLDTLSSSELEECLEPEMETVQKLIFDFEKLMYITSTGIRVLLGALKELDSRGGQMIIRNAGPAVMDVFEIIGLDSEFVFE